MKKKANATMILISLLSIFFISLNIKNINNIKEIKSNHKIKTMKTIDSGSETIVENIKSFYYENYKLFHSTEPTSFLGKYIYITYDKIEKQYIYILNSSSSLDHNTLFTTSSTKNPLSYLSTDREKVLYDLVKSLNLIDLKIRNENKIKNIYPIIKINPVEGFELKTGEFVPQSNFVLIYPKKLDKNNKVVSNDIFINTTNILIDKANKIYKIIENFSKLLSSKQLYKNYKAGINSNFISSHGTAIITKYGNEYYFNNLIENLSDEDFSSTDKYFLNSNGFLVIQVEDLIGTDTTLSYSYPLPFLTEGFRLSPNGIKLETTDPMHYSNDYFLFDFRRELKSNGNYPGFFKISDITGTGIVTSDTDYVTLDTDAFFTKYNKTEIENVKIMCSLNDECGIKFSFLNNKINRIENIPVYEYLINDFKYLAVKGYFNKFKNNVLETMEGEFEPGDWTDGDYFLNKINPFYNNSIEVLNNSTNILIDVSSGFSYEDYSFDNSENVVVFTIGVKKNMNTNCYSCSNNDYIMKKFYIIKG